VRRNNSGLLRKLVTAGVISGCDRTLKKLEIVEPADFGVELNNRAPSLLALLQVLNAGSLFIERRCPPAYSGARSGG